MRFTVEIEREEDGRWLAEIPELSGVLVYGGRHALPRAVGRCLDRHHLQRLRRRDRLCSWPYGVFKRALINYAKGLSCQLAAKGIRVNAVSPGNTYFEGGVWHQIEQNMPELFHHALSLNKTGRMATPQEVATAAVFLVSPVATFITGTNLLVDGALTNRVQY